MNTTLEYWYGSFEDSGVESFTDFIDSIGDMDEAVASSLKSEYAAMEADILNETQTVEESEEDATPEATSNKKNIEKELRTFVQEHFCIIGDRLHLLSADTNEWAPYKRTDALILFYQDYGDMAEEFAKRLAVHADELLGSSKKEQEMDTGDSEIALLLGRATVKKIFNQSILIRAATVWYPGEDTYCNFDSSARLNTFVDNRPLGVVQKEDVTSESYAAMAGFLAHICGYDPARGVELMEDGKSEVAWVAQWLAQAWQHPEQQINTMLWLISETKGIGKGTLWWFINEAFGTALTSEISQAEMESDKNGSMSETLFVQFDEADAFHKAAVSKRLYTLLGNQYLNVRKLYADAFRSPNRIRWLGTTNELYPIILEDGCRRHNLIRCREGDEAKAWAADFWNDMRENDTQNEMIEAFIYIIENMKYDMTFINKPMETELRQQLLETSAPLIERWLNVFAQQWEKDDFLPIGLLWTHFEAWAKRAHEKNFTKKWFYNSLGKLSRFIERPKTVGGKFNGQRGYWMRTHPEGSEYIELSDRMTNLRDHRDAKALGDTKLSHDDIDGGDSDEYFID